MEKKRKHTPKGNVKYHKIISSNYTEVIIEAHICRRKSEVLSKNDSITSKNYL